MNLYEVINPSDKVTIKAEDHADAALATIFLSNGHYGLEQIGGDFELPVFLLAGLAVVEKYLYDEFQIVSLDAAMTERAPRIATVLESAMTGSAATRATVEDALALIADLASREEFLRNHEDRQRSSMNNITGRAHAIARSMRFKLAQDEAAKQEAA